MVRAHGTGAVALLSGAGGARMGEEAGARLRTRLRGLSGVALVERTLESAAVTRYRAYLSAGRHLLTGLVCPANTAGRLGLADVPKIDGYLAAADVAEVGRSAYGRFEPYAWITEASARTASIADSLR